MSRLELIAHIVIRRISTTNAIPIPIVIATTVIRQQLQLMTRTRVAHLASLISERSLFKGQQLVELALLHLVVELRLLLERLVTQAVGRHINPVEVVRLVAVVARERVVRGIVLQKRVEVVSKAELELARRVVGVELRLGVRVA